VTIMRKTQIDQLEGGSELCAWFGGVPSFHDATLRELELRQGAPGRLVLHAFDMLPETDEKGYFLQTKHVVVTLTIHGLLAVALEDFMEAAIIYRLEVELDDNGASLHFSSSYGVEGWIKAKRITVAFEPVKEKT